MKVIALALLYGVVLVVSPLEAQVIVQGAQEFKLSAASFSKTAAGVVVSATITPAPPETIKLNLVVFAPSAEVSLAQVNVTGGRYAMTMDEVGDYFAFDLKSDLGKGNAVGPLIVHELRKRELLPDGKVQLTLRHKLAVRANEPFPATGRLEIALATEGKNQGGEPRFSIVSNSLAGTAK